MNSSALFLPLLFSDGLEFSSGFSALPLLLATCLRDVDLQSSTVEFLSIEGLDDVLALVFLICLLYTSDAADDL